MAGMMRRGYPLPSILESLSSVSRWYHGWLRKMAFHVREGVPFSEVLQKDWVSVPQLVKTLIKVGEEYNILPQALTLACELNKPQWPPGQKRRLLTILLYFLCVGLLQSFIIIVFVVPVFEDMFKSFGSALPLLTQAVVITSRFITGHFLALILVIVLFFVFIRKFRRLGWVPGFTERLPLVGGIIKYSRWWKILYGMGRLFKEGVPLDRTVMALGEGLQMPSLERAGNRMSGRLGEGVQLVEAVRAEKIFPAGVLWAVASGETEDDISPALMRAGEAYKELADTYLSRFTAVTNLIILIILFAMCAALIISVYMPIFQMT